MRKTALLTAAALLVGCGADTNTGGGAATSILSTTHETKHGAFELPTLEGTVTHRYAIDLPPAYSLRSKGSPHQWTATGADGRSLPQIRIWPSKRPATIADAAAQARKGVAAEREVVFEEETGESIIVVARDPDGRWTQVDGWCKGEGLTPHCQIELFKVAADSSQIDWAKRAAQSLRAEDESEPAKQEAAAMPAVGERYRTGGSEWTVVAAGNETIEYTAGEKGIAVAVHEVGPLGTLAPPKGAKLKADPRIPRLWIDGKDKHFFGSRALISAAKGKFLLFLER